jgi:hypothetical protein
VRWRSVLCWQAGGAFARASLCRTEQSFLAKGAHDDQARRVTPRRRSPADLSGAPTEGVTDVSATHTAKGIGALFNASDDTIDMVQKLLTASGGD